MYVKKGSGGVGGNITRGRMMGKLEIETAPFHWLSCPGTLYQEYLQSAKSSLADQCLIEVRNQSCHNIRVAPLVQNYASQTPHNMYIHVHTSTHVLQYLCMHSASTITQQLVKSQERMTWRIRSTPGNSTWPVRSSAIMQPTDQMSTAEDRNRSLPWTKNHKTTKNMSYI